MITELLEVGAKNAKKNEFLASRLGINTRDVSEIVRKERLQGSPICANCYGYFMPETIEDLMYSRSRLFKQAREVRKAAFAVNDTVKRMEMMQKSKEHEDFADILSKIIKEWKDNENVAPVNNFEFIGDDEVNEQNNA